MTAVVRGMTIDDYDAVLTLWENSPGVAVTDDDTREGVSAFLRRNPGLSHVAVEDGLVVGALLCGHDGRRGYISHLAVSDSHRRRGIAGELVDRCVAGLHEVGIRKCHVLVFSDKRPAQSFWDASGWLQRANIAIFSMFTAPDGRDS